MTAVNIFRDDLYFYLTCKKELITDINRDRTTLKHQVAETINLLLDNRDPLTLRKLEEMKAKFRFTYLKTQAESKKLTYHMKRLYSSNYQVRNFSETVKDIENLITRITREVTSALNEMRLLQEELNLLRASKSFCELSQVPFESHFQHVALLWQANPS